MDSNRLLMRCININAVRQRPSPRWTCRSPCWRTRRQRQCMRVIQLDLVVMRILIRAGACARQRPILATKTPATRMQINAIGGHEGSVRICMHQINYYVLFFVFVWRLGISPCLACCRFVYCFCACLPANAHFRWRFCGRLPGCFPPPPRMSPVYLIMRSVISSAETSSRSSFSSDAAKRC